jgi:hypothetical protein
VCWCEEVEPELKVMGLFLGESYLLSFGVPILDSKAKPVEEVPGKGGVVVCEAWLSQGDQQRYQDHQRWCGQILP